MGGLGEIFSTIQSPTPLRAPHLIALSPDVAIQCHLLPEDTSTSVYATSDTTLAANLTNAVKFAQLFSGNTLPDGCTPRAAVYSGHQFGSWAGQLGDGRAISLGQLHGLELQLKGAGPTPYSRGADGRAVLRSSIREFLCSEAMAGLGIPTTRALCIVASDLLVMREAPESTAVVTRVSPSFIRFGSFEHWYYRDEPETLKTLADFVLTQHYPELHASADSPNKYAALLREVTTRTAHLMAQWQTTGFMHGVMNTDNMSILGLSLDFGPFGFMEAFNPQHICNHSDHQGRYSYAMQPQMGQWNCHALGQALLPLIGSVDETNAALSGYVGAYQHKLAALWQAKLGLTTQHPDDPELIASMLQMMHINQLDFTLFFRELSNIRMNDEHQDTIIRDWCHDRDRLDLWLSHYRRRLSAEALELKLNTATTTDSAESMDSARRQRMNRCNPKFILRNYLAQQAIEAAQQHDYSEIERLRHILTNPFDEQPEYECYAALPPDWGRALSVSCSS